MISWKASKIMCEPCLELAKHYEDHVERHRDVERTPLGGGEGTGCFWYRPHFHEGASVYTQLELFNKIKKEDVHSNLNSYPTDWRYNEVIFKIL